VLASVPMAANTDGAVSSPGKRELAGLLGKAGTLWSSLSADLANQFGPLTEKWIFTRKTNHWALQLKQKKRTVLYLIPLSGTFRATFALGEKACAAAEASALPARVLAVIERAPRYPEGRGVALDVRTRKDAEHVKTLAAIKMAN
jgi:Protein of unknown function (DUF3788)